VRLLSVADIVKVLEDWARGENQKWLGCGKFSLRYLRRFRIHESIFLYTKTDSYVWNVQYTPYDEDYLESAYRNQDSNGRRYTLSDITAPGGGKASKGNPHYEFLGVTRYWRFSKETMQNLYKEGRIVQTSSGAVPRQKRYLDEMPGVPLQDLWLDIRPVQGQSAETVGYATQKPETLLDRIINLSSNEAELVLDCFVGSGTTSVVAEKRKRRWIACDLSKFATHLRSFIGRYRVRLKPVNS
jgi:hypothetical protein